MIIELEKKKKQLIFLREYSLKNNKILSEAAHAFYEQYAWAKKCAEITYDCLIEGRTDVTVNFKNGKDKSLKGAIIKITNNNILKTLGSLENLTDDGYLKININIDKNLINNSKEDAINEIYDVIVNELGHGNIYWKRYLNDEKLDDAPEDYKLWINVINDKTLDSDDICYLFCYGLYSTYYQEVQAFVSQTYSSTVKEIKRMYGKPKMITKPQFWNAIIRTNAYQTYKKNIEVANEILKSERLINELQETLSDYNLNYSKEIIIKKCKNIIKKSNDALKSAYNNVYQYFYKSFKN